MAISKDELIAALNLLTRQELQDLGDKVVPITKISRLKEEAERLLNDINAGAARARAIVQSTLSEIQSGNTETIIPRWGDLVTAFRGS